MSIFCLGGNQGCFSLQQNKRYEKQNTPLPPNGSETQTGVIQSGCFSEAVDCCANGKIPLSSSVLFMNRLYL